MTGLEMALAAALRPWLIWRSRRGTVRGALAPLSCREAPPVELPRVRIAVVQFNIDLAASAVSYARHVHALVSQAVEGGASLVIFPEYTSLPLVGLMPGARLLSRALESAASPKQARPADRSDYATMALAFRLSATAAQRVYHATFSTLAARFRVMILGGSIIEPGPDGRLANVAYLYGPDGDVLARQVKTHLMPSEVAMDYARGEEIVVAETPVGRLAFPVCMDHTYFETARIAALLGADLLVDPAANNDYYDAYAQARGVWNRTQEAQVYGVLCCAVGRVAGVVFQGRSGVYAPLGLSANGDGVLAEARSCDLEEIVFAELDYALLREFRRHHPLEYNLALYRRYLPVLYAAEGRGMAPGPQRWRNEADTVQKGRSWGARQGGT